MRARVPDTLVTLLRELWAAVAADRRLLRLSVLGLAVVSVSGLLVAKLLDDVMGADGATGADPTITNWIVGHRTHTLTTAARLVTHLGDPLAVVSVAVAAVGLLLARRHRHLALLIAVSTAGAAIATTVAKFAIQRPRPDASLWLGAASGPAFPSGHATQSVALYAAIAVAGVRLTSHVWAKAAFTVTAALVALAVGGSRLYLAVHWTSDVLCGWAVATAWLGTLLLVGWSRPRLVEAWRTGAPGRAAL